MIVPAGNQREIESEEQLKVLKPELEFRFVTCLEEVVMVIFGDCLWKTGISDDVEERKIRFQKCTEVAARRSSSML